MSRLVKIVDNKYVQIEEHRKPNISFNTNEYDDFENYCTLRETFDPFEMFYENQKYKEVIDKLNNKINLLKTCEDKPKENIIYPHWEICNETKQEMLDILKEVE